MRGYVVDKTNSSSSKATSYDEEEGSRRDEEGVENDVGPSPLVGSPLDEVVAPKDKAEGTQTGAADELVPAAIAKKAGL